MRRNSALYPLVPLFVVTAIMVTFILVGDCI